MKSHVVGKATLISFPNSPGQLLVVDIDITCPECGEFSIRLAGHHLRSVRNLLIEFIDMHPTLTGDDAGLEVIRRMHFEGAPTPTPEQN